MVKVAVIGVGNIGYHHVRVYSKFKDITLVGVADINEEVGSNVASKFKTRFYKNYEELLQRESPNAVSIAVPTQFHKSVAIRTMKYAKNILLEKPIAENMQDAKEIITSAKKKNTNLGIGYIERYNPAILELKKIIQNKKLGKIFSIVVKRVGLSKTVNNKTDVLSDLATHDVDLFNYLLKSEGKIVCAFGGKIYHNTYDYAQLLLDFAGVRCFLEVNWITPVKIRTIAITGSKGYIEGNFITQELTFYQTKIKKAINDFGEFIVNYGNPHKTTVLVNKKEPLEQELRAFLDSINKSKREKIVTGEEALKALMLTENALNLLKKESKRKTKSSK